MTAAVAALAALCLALPFKDRPELAGRAAPEGVDVEEKLGQPVPLDLRFTDWRGRQVTLGEVTGGKPAVLVLAYSRCPALCSVVLSGTARALRGTGLKMGADYRAVAVSIDPAEAPADAAERRRGYLQAMGLSDQGEDWPFLVGAEKDIRALADAVGFRYRYDEALKIYAHPAVSFVLTPDGRLSRYWYGVEYPPRDLRLSLVEASGGRVGTALDRVLLTCFQYDPAARRYGWVVSAIIRGGSLLVFGALAALLAVLWRRELKGGGARA
ncbi:MAG TPA: SCO family protein [Myxococcales bacterium]|nr:SCO family protein [Myxococcales bacterium]